MIQGKSDPFSPFSPMHIFAKEMNEEMKIGSSSCKPFSVKWDISVVIC